MSRCSSTNSRRAASRRPVRSIFPSARPTRRRRSPISRVSRSSTPGASPSSASRRAATSRWRSPPSPPRGARLRAAAAYYPPCANRQGETLDGSDPHPRRRGRFGDAGRGLPRVRRRAAAERRYDAARRSARRRPSVRRSRFRRRPARSGHAFRLRPRRGGARRTGIAPISGDDIVAEGRGRLTPARGWARPAARRASSARAFQPSFRHGLADRSSRLRPEGGTLRRSGC